MRTKQCVLLTLLAAAVLLGALLCLTWEKVLLEVR